jgi:hypothetical protein
MAAIQVRSEIEADMAAIQVGSEIEADMAAIQEDWNAVNQEVGSSNPR